MAKRLIVIDSGHGGTDPGAVNKNLGLKESELALAMGQALSIVLKARGYDVRNTRQDSKALDVNKSKDLSLRAKLANDYKADCFVSIHYNSSAAVASGMEVWHGASKSDAFSSSIGKMLANSFPQMKYRKNTSGGYSKAKPVEQDLAVLRLTKMPAALIECAFINNDNDIKWFLNPGNVKRFAEVIADGIEAYYD